MKYSWIISLVAMLVVIVLLIVRVIQLEGFNDQLHQDKLNIVSEIGKTSESTTIPSSFENHDLERLTAQLLGDREKLMSMYIGCVSTRPEKDDPSFWKEQETIANKVLDHLRKNKK